MNFIPRFLRKREVKASAAGFVIAQYNVGKPVWTERDYEKLARESYVINAIAHRCTKLIAANAASAPWILKDKSGNLVEKHAILDLLMRPNPMNGQSALLETFYAYLLLAGNSYLEVVGPKGKPPRELWTKRPDRMRIIAGAQGMPAAYEYSAGGLKYRFEVDKITGESDILHMREFHPVNDWYGLSRVESAAFAIDRHNASSGHNKALLDNGARPSGALVFKPVKTGPDTVESAPEEVIIAAQDKLKEHIGVDKAGKPLVLGGNVDWIEMGISPKDMDFSEGMRDAARDICVSFGVPHILIVTGQSTYNNVSEAKLDLWESTILPFLDNSRDELNNWLVPKFDADVTLDIDRDAISALEPRRDAKRKSTVLLFDKGIIDSDEAREALQYGPRSADAVRKVDAPVLKALLDAIPIVGFTPLVRYAKSVGLFEANMTEEEIADAAALLIESDEDVEATELEKQESDNAEV